MTYFASSSYSSKSFKQEFGMPMRAYRTRVRVLRAVRLVESCDLKVDAVAASVGFRSRRNFHDAFRRITGRSPSGVRVSSPFSTTL